MSQDFFKGDKKKKKKGSENKQGQSMGSIYVPPTVQIIGKGKKKNDW